MRLAAALVAVLLLAPASAGASICDGHAAVSFIWPPSGEIRAPSNTLLYVGSAWTNDGSTLELRRTYPTEDVIETIETRIVAGPDEITVLRPLEPLWHATYRLFAMKPDGGEIELTIFASEDEQDTISPDVPGDLLEPTPLIGETPDCGPFAHVELRAPFEATVMLLDVLDEDDASSLGDDDDSSGLEFLDPSGPDGMVDGMIFDGGYPDFFDVGRAPCLQTWPGAAPGKATRVRLAALDAAGHFSGWSSWIVVEVPRESSFDPPQPPVEEEPGGCAIGSGPTGGIVGLLLVALAGHRRRWHTAPP